MSATLRATPTKHVVFTYTNGQAAHRQVGLLISRSPLTRLEPQPATQQGYHELDLTSLR